MIGYDGRVYEVGDRVEVHPGCDVWMMGARYGEVISVSGTHAKVRLDRMPKRALRFPEDRLRRIRGKEGTEQ